MNKNKLQSLNASKQRSTANNKAHNIQRSSTNTAINPSAKVEQLLTRIATQLDTLVKLRSANATASNAASQLKAARINRAPAAPPVARMSAVSKVNAAPPKFNRLATAGAKAPRTAVKLATRDELTNWLFNEFCREFKGHTVTVRAVADYSQSVMRGQAFTEAELRQLSETYAGVFKVVKTSEYDDSVIEGSEVIIQRNTNPNRKRLSAIKIF